MPIRAEAQEILGARGVGLAEAQRALANGNDTLYVNPGGMSLSSVYSLEANYLDDLGGGDRRVNASILDSQAGEVSGGVAYTYAARNKLPLEKSWVAHRVDAGLGFRVTETAALGAVLRYVTLSAKTGEADDEAGSYDALTADFGAQYRHENGFAIGAAVANVFNHDAPRLPLSWGAGIGYDDSTFSIEADVRHDVRAKSFRVSAGGGAVLGESFLLRGGGGFETSTKVVDLSVGFGYGTKDAGLEVGYGQRVSGEDPTKPERTLAIGLRLYFF